MALQEHALVFRMPLLGRPQQALLGADTVCTARTVRQKFAKESICQAGEITVASFTRREVVSRAACKMPPLALRGAVQTLRASKLRRCIEG